MKAMDKKQYQAPLTTAIGLRTEALLLVTSKDTIPIEKDGNPISDPNNVYGRNNWDDWDDEEDEEE